MVKFIGHQRDHVLKSRRKILFVVFVVFLISGLLSAYYSFQPDSESSIAAKIASAIKKELQLIDGEIEDVIAVIDSPVSVGGQKFCPFFIYDNDSLIYWSHNKYVPSPRIVSDTFEVKLLLTGSEAYLARKKVIDNNRYIISLILLQRDYVINNDYLNPEWNSRIFPSGNVRILDPGSLAGTPVCIEDNCVFRALFLPGEMVTHIRAKQGACVLILISLVALLILTYDWAKALSRKFGELGFLVLYLSFLVLRVLMTQLNFPHSFIQTSLFDPQIFAVSQLNASLGDLFLNIIGVLVLCRYVFKNYVRFRFMQYRYHPRWSWLLMIFSALCILFAGLFPYVVIQTIYNNSSIVLDISQSLRFDALRIIALIIVLLAGVCSFLFSHAFIKILASERNNRKALTSFFIAILIFILINELTGQAYTSSLIFTIINFSVVYFQRLYASLKRLSYATFAYLFVGIFCLSANSAYSIQYFSEKEKIDNQFRFADNFLIDRDIFGEYLLHEASLKIASDAFTQTRITSPFLGKEAIGQKIRQYFLPSYFNKYDVEILVFNSIGEPVGNDAAPLFSELVNKYNEDASRTEYEGIRFVSNPESDITQKYLIVVPIRRNNVISGYVVIELSLKKIIPENVYPELLVDSRAQQFYRTQDLNYAVFANKKLLFTSGEFNYEKFFNKSWMGITKLYTEGISRDGYDHIAQEDHNGRVAVVSTQKASFAYKLANFSFLFVLGLLIILILVFFQGIYNYFRGSRLFFSARIQLYLNLAFFIPLIIVSISTLSLTSRSSQQQLNEEYLNKSKVFGQEITSDLHDYFYESGDNTVSFSNRLIDLADLSNLDANVYYSAGTLMATSQPLIFENHLISTYINSNVLNKITSGENSFIESERVGDLEYFVAYTILKSPQTGQVLGILGIPFFQSAYLLEKVQIVILINILNIFAFIFIALLVLSYFVSEWLTFPLRFITYSLRRTSLTKTNQPLTWNANDEIGLMVKEYNGMLHKLSESKNELEQTQREKAWREIAQQVAHEIKNPLTPMKLTLQQLERSLQSGNGSVEKSQKAIKALLAQVDTLNEIASSFSGFAKMPELVIRELELISAVKRTVDLHSQSGSISFTSSIKEVLVMGDEQMLNRTFSNLILNGLQAGIAGQSVRIHVSITKVSNVVRVEFQDNGKGIDPKIADLVFLPHFSTKKSGAGLGLAISKQGIEQMRGKIWFETIPGKGTTFFVELPAVS